MKEAVSVSQLNRYIKEMFADNSILNNVIVKGEISNFKESKGNYYFSLKDDASQIQCIIFTSYSGKSVNVDNITDGIEVTIYGKVAVYEKGGTYAIYVNNIEHSGLGEYYIKLEELKKKLYEKGMFDPMYKKKIPKYATNIGVVTAKNGAAIRDIYKTIKDKNPYASVTLYPSLVQGENAYKTIVDGIMELDNLNLERVAYAIFSAKTPIISAVGHEINDSISDLVADARAATPTAAGEMATFSYSDFENDLENYKLTLDDMIEEKINNIKNHLDNAKKELQLLSPKTRVNSYKDNISHKKEKLKMSINKKMLIVKNDLERYIEMLKSRNVLEKISKGMTYTLDKNNRIIKSVKKVKKGETINTRFIDGIIYSKVVNVEVNKCLQ